MKKGIYQLRLVERKIWHLKKGLISEWAFEHIKKILQLKFYYCKNRSSEALCSDMNKTVLNFEYS